MNNDLGILISGAIDVNKTVGQINADLKKLTGQLQKLELNVDLGKATKDIQEFNKNIQSTLGNAGKGIGNVGEQITNSISVDVDKLRKNNAQAFQEIDKLTKHYNSSITSLTRSGGINLADSDEIEKIGKINVAMKDLDGTVRKFQLRHEEDGFKIVSLDEIHNIEKAQIETRKLADAMGKGREQSLARQRQEQERLAQAQAKYSNKAIDDAHKEALAEKKKTDEMQHQLQLARKQAETNVQNLRRRYAPVLTSEDSQALDRYIAGMNSISATSDTARRQIQSLNADFRGISANVAEAGSKVDSFGKQLQVAMTRIPIWMVGMSAFYAPVRGLQSAIDHVVMLDGQMVELRRVMDAAPETYNSLMSESIALSSELGNTVEDVNQAMVEFSRQGYDPSTLIDLTGTATIASNISELSTTEAMSSLTASMMSFNIEASESISIIDKLNEVDKLLSLTLAMM